MTTVNSNGPIGTGESPNLPNGNAVLTTVDLNGREIKNYLWIDAFNSDLNMQIDITQTKRGLSYRPIRLQERTVTFNTVWNVKDRDKYVKLLDNIQTHWAANFNESIPTPSSLTYFGANKTWKGFILNASQAYVVTDVVLRFSFNMKLITPASTTTANTTGLAPFMPTSSDVTNFGAEWYTKAEMEAGVDELIAATDAYDPTQNSERFIIPNGPVAGKVLW